MAVVDTSVDALRVPLEHPEAVLGRRTFNSWLNEQDGQTGITASFRSASLRDALATLALEDIEERKSASFTNFVKSRIGHATLNSVTLTPILYCVLSNNRIQ